MDFAQAQALGNTVGDELVGACQHIDIEFLFVGCVGTYRDDGRPGFNHADPDQGFAGGVTVMTTSAPSIAACTESLTVKLHAGITRLFGSSSAHVFALWGSRPEIRTSRKTFLQSQHFDLVPCLTAGADYCDCGNSLAREIFGGDRASCAGAEVSDETVIEKKSGWGSSVGVEYYDHAVVRG